MALSCEVDGTITAGDLVSYVNKLLPQNIWNFYYYADEDVTNSRIVVMDGDTMEMCREIPCSRVSAHPGSVDRAGYTDKLYSRTTEDNSGYRLEVSDAYSGKWIKDIPFNYPPRSSGGFNQYRGLQAISTKVEPYINVVDANTDTVVITVGDDHTVETIGGNDGGNATGHAVWLDANHFALLDRYRNQIRVFKINEDYPPYTTTETHTLDIPTGCHSLRSAESGHLFSDRVFYAVIEGSTAAKDNVLPQIIKYTFDSSTGVLTPVDSPITFEGVTGSNVTVDWNIHHVGISPDGTKMFVPISVPTGNGQVFEINLSTWVVRDIVWDAGLGCGHADISDVNSRVVITNHYGNTVTIIYMTDDSFVNVAIGVDPEVWGTYTQSHKNHIGGNGRYYFFFQTALGIFYKIDLTTDGIIGQSEALGGTIIQSQS